MLSGKTIVFLPGMDGTGLSFEPLGKILPQDINVEIIQYPTDRLLNFKETVQWAKDQIQSDQKDLIVLAESFSGPVAIDLIGSGQLKANCLILCATFARSPRPILFKVLRCLPLDLIIRLPFPKSLFRHFIEGGDQATELFINMWQRVKTLVPARVLVHRLKIISRVDVRERLSSLPVPCLYIQAASDRSVPPSSLFDFVELVPDLRVKRIKGPHFILQAQPLASLHAIHHFVGLITTATADGG